jgi:hypothetical protein
MEKISLPVSQATLEKLEQRRQKWEHAEWDDTIDLALEIVDSAEFAAGVADKLAESEGQGGEGGANGAAQ